MSVMTQMTKFHPNPFSNFTDETCKQTRAYKNSENEYQTLVDLMYALDLVENCS